MSSKPSSSKSGPRIAPKEVMVTRHKSAQMKRQLRGKNRSMKHLTNLLKSPKKETLTNEAKNVQARPKTPKLKEAVLKRAAKVQKLPEKVLTMSKILLKKIALVRDEEYHPNKVKRKMEVKKVMLKPSHDLQMVASVTGSIKRKSTKPHKATFKTPKQAESPVHELSMGDVIRMVEDDLTDEDLMEILTCPSPVWWEDPPDEEYIEDAIFKQSPPEKEPETKIIEPVQVRKEVDVPTSSKEEIQPIEMPNLPSKSDIFLRKRSKLEILLGHLKRCDNKMHQSKKQMFNDEVVIMCSDHRTHNIGDANKKTKNKDNDKEKINDKTVENSSDEKLGVINKSKSSDEKPGVIHKRKRSNDKRGVFKRNKSSDETPGVVKKTKSSDEKPGVVKKTKSSDDKPGVVKKNKSSDEKPGVVKKTKSSDDKPGVLKKKQSRDEKPGVVKKTKSSDEEPGVVKKTKSSDEEPGVVKNTKSSDEEPGVVKKTKSSDEEPGVIHKKKTSDFKPGIIKKTKSRDDKSAKINKRKSSNDKHGVIDETESSDEKPGVVKNRKSSNGKPCVNNERISSDEKPGVVNRRKSSNDKPGALKKKKISNDKPGIINERISSDSHDKPGIINERKNIDDKPGGVSNEGKSSHDKPDVINERKNSDDKPGVINERKSSHDKPGVINETKSSNDKPGVINERKGSHDKLGIINDRKNSDDKPFVINERKSSDDKPVVINERKGSHDKPGVINKSISSDDKPGVNNKTKSSADKFNVKNKIRYSSEHHVDNDVLEDTKQNNNKRGRLSESDGDEILFGDSSMNEDELLRGLENMDIPIEHDKNSDLIVDVPIEYHTNSDVIVIDDDDDQDTPDTDMETKPDEATTIDKKQALKRIFKPKKLTKKKFKWTQKKVPVSQICICSPDYSDISSKTATINVDTDTIPETNFKLLDDGENIKKITVGDEITKNLSKEEADSGCVTVYKIIEEISDALNTMETSKPKPEDKDNESATIKDNYKKVHYNKVYTKKSKNIVDKTDINKNDVNLKNDGDVELDICVSCKPKVKKVSDEENVKYCLKCSSIFDSTECTYCLKKTKAKVFTCTTCSKKFCCEKNYKKHPEHGENHSNDVI